MKRAGLLLAALCILGSCVASPTTPPSRISDACVIKNERPNWYKAMTRTESKWGVPVTVQMATIYRESKFVQDARTPRRYILGDIPNGRMSSAFGYAQAIDGTWEWYQKDTGNRFARRDDFDDASDFIGWYMDRTLRQNGVAKTDAYRQYLAYHEGHGGYSRGTYNRKSFLLRAAKEVRTMEAKYRKQLSFCG